MCAGVCEGIVLVDKVLIVTVFLVISNRLMQ